MKTNRVKAGLLLALALIASESTFAQAANSGRAHLDLHVAKSSPEQTVSATCIVEATTWINSMGQSSDWMPGEKLSVESPAANSSFDFSVDFKIENLKPANSIVIKGMCRRLPNDGVGDITVGFKVDFPDGSSNVLMTPTVVESKSGYSTFIFRGEYVKGPFGGLIEVRPLHVFGF